MDGSFYREIAEQEAFEKTCEEGEIHHVAALEAELAQVKRERDWLAEQWAADRNECGRGSTKEGRLEAARAATEGK